MKTKLNYLFIALALLAGINQAAAQGTTAFTYQGQLRDGGTNANGAYTMIFKLYTAVSAGNQIGSDITTSPTLANGLFTVNLDFGAGAFNGSALWLDITVTNGGAAETLAPRVQVLPAPYAIFAAMADEVTNHAIMNSQLATNAVATTNIQNNAITTLQIADGAVTNRNLASNSVTSDKLAIDSAGLARVTGGAAFVANNVVSFTGGEVTLAHNYGTSGNSVWNIANGYSEVLGFPGSFMDNLFFVGASGLPAAQIWDQPGTGTRGLASPNIFGTTVSASNVLATGSLGLQQGPSGGTLWSVSVNSAYGLTDMLNISNPQDGPRLLIVPNGNMIVNGSFSLNGSAGQHFSVDDQGEITLDAVNNNGPPHAIEIQGPSKSGVPNPGLVSIQNLAVNNFYGGFSILRTAANNGDLIANGNIHANGDICGATFCGSSDRNLKEKFTPIDNQEVLERVASLPISRWNFKTDAATRHIGPMAQDFYAAFNVGPDDKHIATVDEEGVALAAIQGLNQKLNEKDADIQQLKSQNESLQKRLADLEELVKSSAHK